MRDRSELASIATLFVEEEIQHYEPDATEMATAEEVLDAPPVVA